MSKEELFEVAGGLVDRLDNLCSAAELPLPDAIHLQALRASLPEIRDELRAALVAAGFDPWGDA